eukprot:PITA_02831
MKLVDTEMNNGLFTWNNKRGGESQVASKLDKFIISEDLMLTDKEMIVRILPFGGSDHWPVQMEGTRMFLLHKTLKYIKLKLKDWNKNEFGNIFAVKKEVEDKMQTLNQTLITDGFDRVKDEQVTKLHKDWENLCKQEEIYWRQKSRVQWLKEGE